MSVDQTKRALIETAERLFADHGFDGVTVKRIVTEAGQKNVSALHYHFGTKEGLLRAILEYRMGPINERRQVFLDRLKADGRLGDIRGLVEAIVYPLAEESARDEGGSAYIRFLVQLFAQPRLGVEAIFASPPSQVLKENNRLLAEQLKHLPLPVRKQRLAHMLVLVNNGVADLARRRAEGEPAEALASGLVDSIVGLLTAPVSEQTQGALDSAVDGTERTAM